MRGQIDGQALYTGSKLAVEHIVGGQHGRM
jgi:hypothetical protein